MNQLMSNFVEKLPYGNPYENFDYLNIPEDINEDPLPQSVPLFTQIIEHTNAHLVVEIGSWKGSSAIQIASILRDRSAENALVFCIDTWLGTIDNLVGHTDATWGMGKHYYKNGYPNIYYQFLANIMHRKLDSYILPFPNTSSIGAQWLKHWGYQPDVVYVDGSHDEDDVYSDITSYWNILRSGGVMMGDDYHIGYVGVICAVNRFSREKSLQCQTAGSKWVLVKS